MLRYMPSPNDYYKSMWKKLDQQSVQYKVGSPEWHAHLEKMKAFEKAHPGSSPRYGVEPWNSRPDTPKSENKKMYYGRPILPGVPKPQLTGPNKFEKMKQLYDKTRTGWNKPYIVPINDRPVDSSVGDSTFHYQDPRLNDKFTNLTDEQRKDLNPITDSILNRSPNQNLRDQYSQLLADKRQNPNRTKIFLDKAIPQAPIQQPAQKPYMPTMRPPIQSEQIQRPFMPQMQSRPQIPMRQIGSYGQPNQGNQGNQGIQPSGPGGKSGAKRHYMNMFNSRGGF